MKKGGKGGDLRKKGKRFRNKLDPKKPEEAARGRLRAAEQNRGLTGKTEA